MAALNRTVNSSVEGILHSKSVLFTETVAGATFTGTIVIPAGSVLLDVAVIPVVLWDGTSSTLKVGDAADDDGYFTGVNLVATDLILGERLVASVGSDYWGGKQGAYLTTAGRFGVQSGTGVGGYFAAAGSVIGVVTKTAATGTAVGRTVMTVTYAALTEIAAATAA
jgi:hypothetical protein